MLGDVSELADMKLRGHPLAATRCVVFMWARGLFIAGRPWAMEPGIPRCLNHDKRYYTRDTREFSEIQELFDSYFDSYFASLCSCCVGPSR